MMMQIIPPSDTLLANMPSGREYHIPQEYTIPELSEEELSRMRAPPDPAEFYKDDEDSASDDEQTDPVGAFPGTGSEYGASKNQYF